MGDSLYLLGAEAALALAARYLDGPHRVGDARLFTGARFHLWPEWQWLGDADKVIVTRFLRLRPAGLEEDIVLINWIEQALDRGVRFRWVQRDDDDRWSSTFESVVGKPVDRLIGELLDNLESRRKPRRRAAVDASESTVSLRGNRLTYTIPTEHLATESNVAVLRTTSPKSVALDSGRLLRLAKQLDAANIDSIPHEKVLGELVAELHGNDSKLVSGPISFRGGPTELFVAPTGRGKSVLARMLAIDVASRGTPVAYVVPDVKTVLSETHRIERYVRALGLQLKVAPLNATGSMYEKLAETLDHPPGHDPDGSWTLEKLGYSCRLAAYADGDAAAPGHEPCNKLHQIRGHKTRPVSCPFASDCPKFDTHRDAVGADIVVVNHWAFLMGILPIPVEVNAAVLQRMSLLEVSFRRAGLVIVDEIDQLQGTAIQRGTGNLQITSRQRMSPLHQLFEEFDRRKAAGDLPPDPRLERVRRPVILVRWLSEELADQINRGDLKWSSRDKLRWSRARDSWLAKRLFGSDESAQDQLAALFEDAQLDVAHSEELRQTVRKWTDGQLDERKDTQALRAQLFQCLASWPRTIEARASRIDKTRARVVDALILRAILARLEQALNHLRAQLPLLDQYGVTSASVVRDALLGYSSWTPSPLGPLGRRTIGFSFQKHGSDDGALHVQALAGDPHGLVAGLGNEVAYALSGAPRVVLGMSATARFPGSPKADVQSPIAIFQPDEGDSISVNAIVVTDVEDGTPVRVSGISTSSGRQARAARLGSLLWHEVLQKHLAALAAKPETFARARALLVTGSYSEAKAVAATLAHAMDSTSEAKRRIRVVQKQKIGDEHPPAIAPRELEGFGATGADVLVAPLSVVARGHNILAPGTDHSAIASIFVLVRPVPPAEQPEHALAHLSYDSRRRGRKHDRPGEALEAERRRAEQQLRFLQQSAGPFSHLPSELRHQVLCDVLVDIAQLAGRARRGGTDVGVYLVDGAFHDDLVGWAPLLQHSFTIWREGEHLDEMMRLHRPFMRALQRFAGVEEQ